MKTTNWNEEALARFDPRERLRDEIASLAAHVNAAIARWLELVLSFRDEGGAAGDDFASWLAFRCGISAREAREYLRVADALEELPEIRAAFARGELTFSKVRALTRVATPACEQALLELAGVVTASQLERALRAFRRIASEEARETTSSSSSTTTSKRTAPCTCARGCPPRRAPSWCARSMQRASACASSGACRHPRRRPPLLAAAARWERGGAGRARAGRAHPGGRGAHS